MRSKFLAFTAALFLIMQLQGCGTSQAVPTLPTRLVEQGLLVARIYVAGMHGLEDAQINIDGQLHASSMRNGYVAIALEPGEHKLTQLRTVGQLLGSVFPWEDSPYRNAYYIYIPGSTYTIHYTTLDVNRTFKIEPGKITNLGLMIYLPVPENKDKKSDSEKARMYRTILLNNSTEAGSFLKENYPDLMQTVKDTTISLAPGNYLENDKLSELRRAIAYYEMHGNNYISNGDEFLVYGEAGTIVALNKTKTSDKPDIKVLDTGTLADVLSAVKYAKGVAFLTADARLLLWKDGKLSSLTLPYQVQPVTLRPFGGDGLIVVDNHMRIYTTKDPNGEWKKIESAVVKTARNDISVDADGEGAYISMGNGKQPDAIYYLKPEDAAPKPIVPPGMPDDGQLGSASWFVPIARPNGLFLVYGKPAYYFWSKERQRWEYYHLPKGKCEPLSIDKDGAKLSVQCDGKKYHSEDLGVTWNMSGT